MESHYLDTFKEAAVQLKVDVHSFATKEAIWEVYRSKEEKEANVSKKFQELVGLVAYFGIGKKLRIHSMIPVLRHGVITAHSSAPRRQHLGLFRTGLAALQRRRLIC